MTSYPNKARIDGRDYPINTDFRIGLKCMKIVNDPDISDFERSVAIVYLLFGFIPEGNKLEKFILMSKKFLEMGRESDDRTEPDFDFEQDEVYIKASFMSDYHIDLNAQKMHWWQFVELIGGLTPNCILSRIREIRNEDVNDYTGKYKTKLLKAKADVAIKRRKTAEEKEAERLFELQLGGGVNE